MSGLPIIIEQTRLENNYNKRRREIASYFLLFANSTLLIDKMFASPLKFLSLPSGSSFSSDEGGRREDVKSKRDYE